MVSLLWLHNTINDVQQVILQKHDLRINTNHDFSEQKNIAIFSKTNGWLTVDSKTLSRKKAFEKTTLGMNNKTTSPLSPDWMQRTNYFEHK